MLNQQFVINETPSPFMLLPTKKVKGHFFIPLLITDSGDMAISNLDKANTLNSVFLNVLITDYGQDLHFSELCNMTKMNCIEVTGTANDSTTAFANTEHG